MTIDGVRIQFQMAQGSEAPSEFMFYFPDKKALCLSEVATKLMHNVYTIRGAQVRDALGWSKYINETMDLFPDAEVAFASHHWPTWGKDNIRALPGQPARHLPLPARPRAEPGQPGAEMMDETRQRALLPQGPGRRRQLARLLRHAEPQPARGLQLLPRLLRRQPGHARPAAAGRAAKRYVAAMGGEAAVLAAGRKAFADGDYRWAAEMVNHAVFANPASAEARALQADALEQLGYQAESATWRNAYLMGAQELRAGPQGPARQLDQPGHGARHEQRTAVRLHRAAPGPQQDRRHEGRGADGLHRHATRPGRWSCRTRCSTTPRAAC